MGDLLENIATFVLFVAASVLTIATIWLCIDVFTSDDNYSYVTDDGTSGAADYCDNGKGGLYCTKDGRTFTVKNSNISCTERSSTL